MDPAQGEWYILETNYDHWEKPFFIDDRRTPANNCMKKLTQKASFLTLCTCTGTQKGGPIYHSHKRRLLSQDVICIWFAFWPVWTLRTTVCRSIITSQPLRKVRSSRGTPNVQARPDLCFTPPPPPQKVLLPPPNGCCSKHGRKLSAQWIWPPQLPPPTDVTLPHGLVTPPPPDAEGCLVIGLCVQYSGCVACSAPSISKVAISLRGGQQIQFPIFLSWTSESSEFFFFFSECWLCGNIWCSVVKTSA